jgi:hypothetical protein
MTEQESKARWTTIRPWLPPVSSWVRPNGQSSTTRINPTSSSSSSRHTAMGKNDGSKPAKLNLEVLDVTATAVAISILIPSSLSSSSSSSSSSSTTPKRRRRTPVISIQLDRRPWPHVAHAGSGGEGGRMGNLKETTVIIYGLDPGREYEISLDVTAGEEYGDDNGGEQEDEEEDEEQIDDEEDAEELANGVEDEGEGTSIEEGEEGDSIIERERIRLDTSSSSASSSSSPTTTTPTTYIVASEDYSTPTATASLPPPPPYSYSTPPARPTEASLRDLLKKIRASSKRTETVLNSSIIALKKGVEKGMKEDQRSRTRIGGLEEAIRKAGEGEEELRKREMGEVEEQIREMNALEARAEIELEIKREMDKHPIEVQVVSPVPYPALIDEGGEEEETVGSSAELARELDQLNKAIEEIEKDRSERAQVMRRALETEMGSLEGELQYLERAEAHLYSTLNERRSEDSMTMMDPRPYQPHQQLQHQQQPQQRNDPGTFSRFFRRNSNVNIMNNHSSNGSDASLPAEFIPATPIQFRSAPSSQHQSSPSNLWGAPTPGSPIFTTPSDSAHTITTSVIPSTARFFSTVMRRRSGSLNIPTPEQQQSQSRENSLSNSLAVATQKKWSAAWTLAPRKKPEDP